MKTRFLIAVLAALLFASSMQAQKKGTTELGFRYGRLSTNELGNAIAELGLVIFTLDNVERTDARDIGAIGVSLKVAPYDRLTLGVSVTYEQINSDVAVREEVIGSQNLYFLTGAFELDYRYVTAKQFQMYFGLAGGGTLLYDVYNANDIDSEISGYNEFYSPYPNFHVTALGFRFGDNIGITAEFGFGYKGMVNLGISFQPKPLE